MAIAVPGGRAGDRESVKRLTSGFWKHEYDHCSQVESWTCDKRKLHDWVGLAMTKERFRYEMTQYGPTKVLDGMFGYGTSEAYHHSSPSDRVCMKIRDKDKEMAIGLGNWTTSSGTDFGIEFYDVANMMAISQMPKRNHQDAVRKQEKFIAPSRGRLVRKFPFKVESGGSLLSSLQREFDHCCGPVLADIFG